MQSSKTSDARLIDLFLDMLAAEQGAGSNTLDAYRRDLTDFSGFLAGRGEGLIGADTEGVAGLPRRSRPTRLQSLERRAQALGDAAPVSFFAQRKSSQR